MKQPYFAHMSGHLLEFFIKSERHIARKLIYHLSASLNETCIQHLYNIHPASGSNISTDERLIKGNMCVGLLFAVQLLYCI